MDHNAGVSYTRWIVRIMVAVLSVLLTLVSVESVLAFLAPIPQAREVTRYFIPDPHTGYRLEPYTDDSNSFGHRDDEVEIDKEPDVYRILVLGDSFSAGTGVERDEAYPQLLETLLNRAASVPVEVVNSGVGGWEPFHYAQYYEHYGRNFSADLVLVGFFVGNDALARQTDVDQLRTTVQGRRVSREAASLPWIHAKVWLHQNSHLARVIWRRGAATDYLRASCEDFTEEFLRNQRYRLPNHLRRDASVEAHVAVAVEQMERIQELARRDGASLLVVFLPDETQINGSLQTVLLQGKDPGRYDFDMPQPMLSEMLAVRDFTTVDLLPAFREDPRCLYANNTHWTPEGHAFAAALIAEAVLELGVIPSPGQAVPSD